MIWILFHKPKMISLKTIKTFVKSEEFKIKSLCFLRKMFALISMSFDFSCKALRLAREEYFNLDKGIKILTAIIGIQDINSIID